MDVRFDSLVEKAKRDGVPSKRFYQELVARAYDDAWPTLVAMGRPLWDRVKRTNFDEPEDPSNVIQLAANKLLGGLSAKERKNFNEASMFGVASVLCRVGLRPNSWSPFASRAIADFMAVLLYSTFSLTQLLTTYSSDPILTFGAARVWYQSAASDGGKTQLDEQAPLAEVILPQLRKMLRQDVVDTGAIGEFVSRQLLLLAMDATGVVLSKSKRASTERHYAGEFRSVKVFLNVLYGSRNADGNVTVLNGFRIPVKKHDVTKMLNKLRDWKVGFSHFVQASREPDEDLLWAMLARRSAGIFPRNFKGVDLFIPIFKGSEVSMIVVQVKNHAAADPSFPESASISMRPSAVFTNEFQRLDPTKVVRIYMSLRGPNATERNQFYLADNLRRYNTRSTTAEDKESYVLCLEGLGPWSANRVGSGEAVFDLVPVVSNGVAEELRLLLQPWWDVMQLVEDDLDRRKELGRVGVDGAAVRSIVSRPTVSSLLSAWPDRENVARQHETVATTAAATTTQTTVGSESFVPASTPASAARGRVLETDDERGSDTSATPSSKKISRPRGGRQRKGTRG